MPLNPELIKSTTEKMPGDEGIKSLSELGSKLALELNVQAELNKAIEESKKITQQLQDVAIPEKMVELGLEEIKLPSGEKIALVPVFGASVPDARKPEAWGWLRANGHGALIKTTFNMAFGMGEEKESERAKVTLLGANLPFREKEDVHPGTLKAFVKERYEKGEKFPEQLFGAFTKTIAQIK